MHANCDLQHPVLHFHLGRWRGSANFHLHHALLGQGIVYDALHRHDNVGSWAKWLYFYNLYNLSVSSRHGTQSVGGENDYSTGDGRESKFAEANVLRRKGYVKGDKKHQRNQDRDVGGRQKLSPDVALVSQSNLLLAMII